MDSLVSDRQTLGTRWTEGAIALEIGLDENHASFSWNSDRHFRRPEHFTNSHDLRR
jgi:hypothetical protein